MSVSVPFCVVFLSGISLIAGYDSSVVWPWSWDSIAMGADFAIHSDDIPIISETRAKFLADHYYVWSIEKCTESGTYTRGYGQEALYETISLIREFGSSDKIKLLFYWNVGELRCYCYGSTPGVVDMCSNTTYNPTSSERLKYDHSIPYVRHFCLNTMMMIVAGAFINAGTIDGIFLDGAHVYSDSNIAVLLNETKEAVEAFNQKYGTNLYIIANGLGQRFGSTYNLELVPYVDGVMIEHFATFEEVQQTETGSYDADDLLYWFDVVPDVIHAKYGANKAIFVKATVGPAVWVNDVTWPAWYGAKPTTNEKWQNVSAQLITFPLAVYLCGMLYENVYFQYGWWYMIDHGYVPCPEDPSSCYSPPGWYPELTNDLGAPLTDPIMTEKYKCNRSFEHANVYVDLRVDASAIIEWIPPIQSPTASPISGDDTSNEWQCVDIRNLEEVDLNGVYHKQGTVNGHSAYNKDGLWLYYLHDGSHDYWYISVVKGSEEDTDIVVYCQQKEYTSCSNRWHVFKQNNSNDNFTHDTDSLVIDCSKVEDDEKSANSDSSIAWWMWLVPLIILCCCICFCFIYYIVAKRSRKGYDKTADDEYEDMVEMNKSQIQ